MEDKKLDVKRIRQEIDKESNENELISRLNNNMAGIKVETKKVSTKVNANFDDAEDSVDEFVTKCRESLKNKELVLERLKGFGTDEGRDKFRRLLAYKNKQEVPTETSCENKKNNEDIDITAIVGDKSRFDYLVKCKGDERVDDEDKPILNKKYEMVNHPKHYNNYDVEVVDMMERIWGTKATMEWCKMTAYKYRMRMGTKPGKDETKESMKTKLLEDFEKEQWYLDKAAELKEKLFDKSVDMNQ